MTMTKRLAILLSLLLAGTAFGATYTETFTGSSGTALETYDADWSKLTALGGVISDANRYRAGASNNGSATYSRTDWTPATADYDLEWTVYRAGTPANDTSIGAAARIVDLNNYYFVRFENNTGSPRSVLAKRVTGSVTNLATYSHSLTDGNSFAVKWSLRSNTLRVWIDGTLRLSATDSAYTNAGTVGIHGYERSSDATGYHLDDLTLTDYVVGPGGPAFESAEITTDATGRKLAVTFSEAVNYYGGQITLHASPLAGQTDGRTISTTGTPSGDGTDTLTFDLQDGKPVCDGETVTIDLPLYLVTADADDSLGSAVATGQAVTNNSVYSCPPVCRFSLTVPEDIYTADFAVEVEALHPLAGEVDSVTLTVDDGTPAHLQTYTLTSRSASSYTPVVATQTWVPLQYCATVDVDTLDPGPLTLTATATAKYSMGTREVTQTVYNNRDASLGVKTVYLAPTSAADDSGNGLTVGTAKKTFGAAMEVIRLHLAGAAGDAAQILVTEASTVDPTLGNTGNQFTSTRRVLLKPNTGVARADVVVQVSSAATSGITWPQYNSVLHIQDLTINCSESDSAEELAQLYKSCALKRCIITHGNASPHPTGAEYLCRDVTYYFVDCRFHDLLNGPGYFTLARNCEVENFASDFMYNCEGAIVACKAINRGMGREAFTVYYDGANATATVAKTGDHGTGSLVLTDSAPTSFDLTNASYDTVTELVDAINLVSGWHATAVDPEFDADNMRAFSAIDCKGAGATKTIYQVTGFHGDLMQWWGATHENIVVNGVRSVPFDEAQYPGLTSGGQILFLDWNALTVNGMCLVNIDSPNFQGEQAFYSQFHNALSNVLVGFSNLPHQRFRLHYAYSGSEFNPTNFVVTGVVNRNIFCETGGTGADVYIVDNHYDNESDTGTLAKGTDYTVGSVADEYVSLVASSLDMTPAADGNLIDRLPVALDIGDAAGKSRAGDIGALEYRDPPVAAITSDDPQSGNVGDTITLTGTGTDAEDGALSGASLVWTSDLDGALGTGSPLAIDTLTAGEHTITLTVTDSDGATDTDTCVVTITAPAPGNQDSAVRIGDTGKIGVSHTGKVGIGD